jgi:hypothetical protein
MSRSPSLSWLSRNPDGGGVLRSHAPDGSHRDYALCREEGGWLIIEQAPASPALTCRASRRPTPTCTCPHFPTRGACHHLALLFALARGMAG